ncbi:MAG TPA: hypothetical protein VF816_09545 [Rhodocyclaceae bacterium]
MHPEVEAAAQGLISLSYWSPSASNFLSLIVMALGLDMRIRADAIKVLRLISSSPAEELLDVLETSGCGGYRELRGEAFADLRRRATTLARTCLDFSLDRGMKPVAKDMRRLPDRRVNLLPYDGPERRHIADRRRSR